MRDLKYTGEEPEWIRREFLDKFVGSQASNPSLSEFDAMKADIERLTRERNVLSLTLEKQ